MTNSPASAWNRPGTTGFAAPAAPKARRGAQLSPTQQAPAPAKSGTNMPTSSVIAWWRVVLVIVCLAAAVITPLMLDQNRQSVERVNAATQQMLRLETVRSDLLGAEAASTQALLMTTDGQSPNAGYLGLVDSAAAELIAAAAASPADSASLQDINTAMSRYVAQLAVAMHTGGQPDMLVASQQLADDVLPLLDAQIAQQTSILESSGGNQQWLIALLAVPLLLLAAASIVIARRTRRVLNLGLVLAFAGAVASGVIVTQLVTTSAASISAVQTSGVSRATAVAQAYGAVTEAKAAEGRILLGITDPASGAQTYSDATGRADQALSVLGDSQAADQLTQMISTHEQLMAAPEPPSSELVASAQAPYDWLIDWLTEQSSSIGQEVDADLSGHAETVENLAVLVAGIMVFAAVSSAVGLSGSLRRYR